MRLTKNTKMSLSDATKPLLVYSRLIGMNPKSKWHKIYTASILVCLLSILVYFWRFFNALKLGSYYYNLFVGTLQELCRSTSLLVILGSGLFDQKRFLVPLMAFAKIDENLKRLGRLIDNGYIHRLQILLVIFAGPIPLFITLVEFRLDVWTIPDDFGYRIISKAWFYNSSVIIICTLADCCFTSTLCIIKKRFKAINLIIYGTRKRGSYLTVDFVEVIRVYTDEDLSRKLRILRQQYHDLWRIASQVNGAYGLHLLVGTLCTLIQITRHSWKGYFAITNPEAGRPHDLVVNIVWFSFYVTKMFLIVLASESTVADAKATSVVLQELGIRIDDDRATKNEIRDFLTQIQFEVRKFTACGFFDFDFTFFGGIFGAACTYVVILIQVQGNLDACVVINSTREIVHFSSENNS